MLQEIQAVKSVLGKYVHPKLFLAGLVIFAILGILSVINDFRRTLYEIADLKQQMELRSLEIAEKKGKV